jgi:hypothetical protein
MALQGLGVADKKIWRHHQIAVNEDDHIASGLFDTTIATKRRTSVVLANQAYMGERSGMVIEPTDGVIGGAIINKDHFIALKRSLNILRLKSLKALAQNGQPIVGRDNDADKHLLP